MEIRGLDGTVSSIIMSMWGTSPALWTGKVIPSGMGTALTASNMTSSASSII